MLKTIRMAVVALVLSAAFIAPAVIAQQAEPAPRTLTPIAAIETERGTIRIRLYPEETPNTVENFIKLAEKGFYNGLTFHRVVPGFVVQGGDPRGDGTGGPGYTIPNEPNKQLRHNRGAVAMANAGRDTAGSQFYIVIGGAAPHLDNGDYTIFGQVIDGQEVAESLRVGDKMTTVTISRPGAAQ